MTVGFSKVQWGDGLAVTDEGDGVIRIDGGGRRRAAGASGRNGADRASRAAAASRDGGDLNYVHTQARRLGLLDGRARPGQVPAVSVVDTGGNEIIPNVHYVDANNVTVAFSSATSGKAYVN